VKRILLSVMAGLALAVMPTAMASAWSFKVDGQGKCQPDGSFKIVWVLNNKSENKALTITQSNRASVPAGSIVPADQDKDFPETVDGTQPGEFTLTVKGNWPGEEKGQSHTKSVTLKEACEQPPTITVKKQTSPTGDQTAFSISIASSNDGQVFGNATQSIKDGGSVIYKVSPGTYNVTEAALDGWTLTSNTCNALVVGRQHDGELVRSDNHNTDENMNQECLIVNTKKPSTAVLGATTQVQAPKGGVGAGSGGASSASFGAALGIVGSLGAVGYGLRRLSKV
jgi:VCBS repeat-containing protein